jgi:hypothetical protein
MMNHIIISMATAERQFQALYGTNPFMAAILWYEITIAHPWRQRKNGCQPKHLVLWAMLFLKTYATENLLSAVIGTEEKTYRKWVWFILEGLSRMSPKFVSPCFGINEVSIILYSHCLVFLFSPTLQIWLDRQFAGDAYQRCLMVIDGINFTIYEPRGRDFDTSWYSQKHNCPGV